MTIGHPNLLDRPIEWNMTDPGMAFFAGTGPAAETCGTCKFRGYHRPGRDKFDPTTGAYYTPQYRVGACGKYLELTGIHGPDVDKHLPACKYFEPTKKVEQAE